MRLRCEEMSSIDGHGVFYASLHISSMNPRFLSAMFVAIQLKQPID